MRRFVPLTVLIALFSAAAFPQARSAHAATPGFARASSVHPGFAPAGRNAIGWARASRFHARGYGRSASFFGDWPYDGEYPDYDYGPDYESAPPPPLPEPAPQVKEQSPPPSPALLELQGNQWVKVNNFTMPANSGGAQTQLALAKEMPPAVIVFRDGRTEELTNYTIIDGAIHTRADYWTSGAWTRTIQIADLDIPATLKQNQDRGVNFELPSGPNEVVIRP